MARFYPIFWMLLLAVMLSMARATCDVIACKKLIPSEEEPISEQCRKIKEAIKCAQTTLLNNPDCSQPTKLVVREMIINNRKIIVDKCGGAGYLTPSLLLCLAMTGVTYILTSVK